MRVLLPTHFSCESDFLGQKQKRECPQAVDDPNTRLLRKWSVYFVTYLLIYRLGLRFIKVSSM